MKNYIPQAWRAVTVRRLPDGSLSNPLAFPPTTPTEPFKGFKTTPAGLVGTDRVPGKRISIETLQASLVAKNQIGFTLAEVSELTGFNCNGLSGSQPFQAFMGGLLRAGRILKGQKGKTINRSAVVDFVSSFEEIE